MIISAISVLSSLSFSTTDQGSDRIGAWVDWGKKLIPDPLYFVDLRREASLYCLNETRWMKTCLLTNPITPLICCTKGLIKINRLQGWLISVSRKSFCAQKLLRGIRTIRAISVLSCLSFSTTDHGISLLGALVILKKKVNSHICQIVNYRTSLMNKNRPSHQSVQSPDPLY